MTGNKIKFDFYAHFEDKIEEIQGQLGIDKFSPYSKIKLSSLKIARDFEKTKTRKDAYQPCIESEYEEYLIKAELVNMKEFKLVNPEIKLNVLPDNSFFISIPFVLRKHFLSNDDENLYINDNPVCKEKVFKVPLVRASSWKGVLKWNTLKWILDQIHDYKDNPTYEKRNNILNYRILRVRLFGNEKGGTEQKSKEDNLFRELIGEEFNQAFYKKLKEYKITSEQGSRRGNLIFFPSFFNKIGLDIINPHDRKTKTGKNPIWLETVPPEAEGTFSLLYVASDRKPLETDELKMLKDTIFNMLNKYGIGGKISSGYGISEILNIEIKSNNTDFEKILNKIFKKEE